MMVVTVARRVLLALCVSCGMQACSGDDAEDGQRAGSGGRAPGGGSGGRFAGSGADDDGGIATGGGACGVATEQHELGSTNHVLEPLPPSAYNSSPPSSGPHCASWGRYDINGKMDNYTPMAPLPACNFVHNLEHGAIVLLYNCPDGCEDTVAALEAVIKSVGPDPDCVSQGIKRIVLTPYADMDATVAASAWGHTFTASCLDDGAADALIEFIEAHWGSRGDAPEATLCFNGGA
jgi:hypothetical protein